MESLSDIETSNFKALLTYHFLMKIVLSSIVFMPGLLCGN